MRPLVLTAYGTHISVQGRTLTIKHGAEGPVDKYQPQQLPFDTVILESNTGSISLEAMRFLAVHNVTLNLMRWNGNILSTTHPRGPNHGKVRLAQAAAYGDKQRRLRIARELIREKVAKTIELAEHLAQFYPVDAEPIKLESKAGMGRDIRELMTYEGRVAQAYWPQYARAIESLWPDSGFKARKRPGQYHNNNAGDPINALLNYGYALLESACRSAINNAGLLPEIGFLHEAAPSKFPLAYDLQEPFRWLVDLTVVQLLRDAKLSRRDFIVTENYHVRLRPETATKLTEAIAANFNRTVAFEGRRRSYQVIITDTARNLAKHLQDARTKPRIHSPFDIEETGRATADLAAKIAALPLSTHKQIGITKAGLYYIQQRVAEGKPLRLYGKVSTKIVAYLEGRAEESPVTASRRSTRTAATQPPARV